MTVPQDIGRIPGKISCSFSGFTADQWKNWTTVYSLFALNRVLPHNHLECWRNFVLACKFFGKRVLTDNDIDLGDEHSTGLLLNHQRMVCRNEWTKKIS